MRGESVSGDPTTADEAPKKPKRKSPTPRPPKPPGPPQVVAVDHRGATIDHGVKVCTGAGLARLRGWLRDSGKRALLLSEPAGTGTQMPLVILDWSTWSRVVARVIVRGGTPQESAGGHSSLVNPRS